MDIRNRIRRTRLGLSQKEYARLAGVDISTVRRWENSPNGYTPNNAERILDRLIQQQDHAAEQAKETYAEENRTITALLWPNQQELERQTGHAVARSYEQDNADTIYIAQALEQDGHKIEYRQAPVLTEDGTPDPAYEQDGATIFIADGNPSLNAQERHTLERLLKNNGTELDELLGSNKERTYSVNGLPADLYNLNREWAERLEGNGGHISPVIAELIIWRRMSEETRFQYEDALKNALQTCDSENVRLAADSDTWDRLLSSGNARAGA